MARTKQTTKHGRKSSRPDHSRSQPAKPAKPIYVHTPEFWYSTARNVPDSPNKRRAIVRTAVREMDDQGITSAWFMLMLAAEDSATRRALAELAHIKRTCAIIPAKMAPASQIVPIKRRARS